MTLVDFVFICHSHIFPEEILIEFLHPLLKSLPIVWQPRDPQFLCFPRGHFLSYYWYLLLIYFAHLSRIFQAVMAKSLHLFPKQNYTANLVLTMKIIALISCKYLLCWWSAVFHEHLKHILVLFRMTCSVEVQVFHE